MATGQWADGDFATPANLNTKSKGGPETIQVAGDDTDRSTRATAVQNAIDAATNNNKPFVFVPDNFLNYDASSVTFDNSVRMVREGQQADVYDVKAYGAVGDDPGDGTGTDDEPAIEAALSAAGANDPVVLQGNHAVGTALDLSSDTHTIDFREGTLIPTGDHVVLRTPASANRLVLYCNDDRLAVDASGVTGHSSTAVEFRCRVFTQGTFRVKGGGNHGIHVLQEGSASPFPSRVTCRVESCGGDGVRFENTTGGVSNLNGLVYEILEASGCSVGVRLIDGIGLKIFAVTENNTNEGFRSESASSGSTNRGHDVVLFDDSSNGSGITLSGGSGFLTGFLNSGRPTSGGGSWTVLERRHNEFQASAGAGSTSRPFALRNQSANDSNESVDLPFLGNTGLSNEELFKIRAQGNAVVQFLSGLRYLFDDGIEIQDSVRESLSGDKALTGNDPQFQNLDPNGAARNVDLPPEGDGKHFLVGCRGGASNDITLRDDTGATLATINPGDVAVCHSDGTGWMVNVSAGAVT